MGRQRSPVPPSLRGPVRCHPARGRPGQAPGPGRPDGSSATLSRLDPYEAAYLNGGGSLVAATAFSSLLRGGFVTVRAPGLGERWLTVPLG